MKAAFSNLHNSAKYKYDVPLGSSGFLWPSAEIVGESAVNKIVSDHQPRWIITYLQYVRRQHITALPLRPKAANWYIKLINWEY